MNTIADIIKIAKISQYLCVNDIDKKGLYGGGVDLLLPDKIYNIRKSVEWAFENPMESSYVNATATITINDIGNDGDIIEVSVNDPDYGIIVLGVYIKQSTDTDTTILAQNILNAIALNTYGYGVESEDNIITIQARNNLGSSINGDGRFIVSILPNISITQFSGGITNLSSQYNLQMTSNYLYALCAPYSLEASYIANNPNTGVIVNPTPVVALKSPIRITSTNFADATHWDGDNNDGQTILPTYTLQVFGNFIARYLEKGTEWERTPNGIVVLLPGFDATANNYEFYISISL